MRDLPSALTRLGMTTTVATPSYGMFHTLPGARRIGSVGVAFAGDTHEVDVFDVPGPDPAVRNVVFEHARFSPRGPGNVYCSDEPGRPFATDASKFAFFSAALAAWITALPQAPDVVHLHDWHTGFFLMLREFGADSERLAKLRTVFTIHNLAYQGIRPIAGDASSLESWYPGLRVDISSIRDPRYADCINPMAAAIRLSDRISTVSPSYAEEICRASDPASGFVGGEGLENDLAAAARDGRLVGILNGCEYPARPKRRPTWSKLLTDMRRQVEAWQAKDPGSDIHALAAKRLASLPKRRPDEVLLSVGRLVSQKVSLFLESLPSGALAIEEILTDLGPKSTLIVLGSGDPGAEQSVLEVARRAPNLLFLRGYAESLADELYRSADLFLMPSSFEPCGISQMLAMRDGVPCVVHGVGGLRDTVNHCRTGFVFTGDTPRAQAVAFADAVASAVDVKRHRPTAWRRIREAASERRFDWALAARMTKEALYGA